MKLHRQQRDPEKLVVKFCQDCQIVLTNLANAVAAYREVAAKTNERQPLVKRKEPQHK